MKAFRLSWNNRLVTLMAVAIAPIAQANERVDLAPSTDIQAVQDQLQRSFQNITVTNFGLSPIAGIYEFSINERVFYYAANEDILIAGDMYNADGVSLTDQRFKAQKADTLSQLNVSNAITTTGTQQINFVEFVNLNCSYCAKGVNFLETTYPNLVRNIVLVSAIETQAYRKHVHVLCSKHPSDALVRLFKHDTPEALLDCDKGHTLAKQHNAMAKALGIGSTPTYWIGGEPIVGYKKRKLKNLIDIALAKSGNE